MSWYVSRAGKRHGPFSPKQLKQLAASGKLKPDDSVCKEGMADWVSASRVQGLFTASAPEPASASHPESVQIDRRVVAATSARRRNLLPWAVAGATTAVLALVLLVFLLLAGGDSDAEKTTASRSGKTATDPPAVTRGTRESPVEPDAAPTPPAPTSPPVAAASDAVRALRDAVTSPPPMGPFGPPGVMAPPGPPKRGEGPYPGPPLGPQIALFREVEAAVDKVRDAGHEEAAVDAMVEVLDQKHEVRGPLDAIICGKAIHALARLGPSAKRAISSIEQLKDCPIPGVSFEVTAALREIGESEGTTVAVIQPPPERPAGPTHASGPEHQQLGDAIGSQERRILPQEATAVSGEPRSPAERLLKRSDFPEGSFDAWLEALNGASKEFIDRKSLFLSLPNVDCLYSDDVFQKSASEKYLKRVRSVPLQSITDWNAALQPLVNQRADYPLMETLLTMMQLDGLFPNSQFDRRKSELFVSRLKTVPKGSVHKLAEASDQQNLRSVAVRLVTMDPYFKNGVFQDDEFGRQLDQELDERALNRGSTGPTADRAETPRDQKETAVPPTPPIASDEPFHIASVKLKRLDAGEFEASITLSKPLPEELKEENIRFLFLKNSAGVAPETATDIDASGSVAMVASHPWMKVGGVLDKEGEVIGFVLDLDRSGGWAGAQPTLIKVPLNGETLLPGMARYLEEGGGILLAAFVDYGPDGNTKVTISNTVRATVP